MGMQQTASSGLQEGFVGAPFADRISKSAEVPESHITVAQAASKSLLSFLSKSAPAPGALNTDGMLVDQMQISYAVDNAEFLSVLGVALQVDVPTLLAKYFVWTQESRLSQEAEPIQEPGTAAVLQMGSKQESFGMDTYGARFPVTDMMLRAQNNAVNVIMEATNLVNSACFRRIANEVVSDYYVASAWDHQIVGFADANTRPTNLKTSGGTDRQTTFWSDHGSTATGTAPTVSTTFNSNPIDDFLFMMEEVYKATGGNLDSAALAPAILRALRNHPGLLYRIAGGQTTGIAAYSDQALANVLDMRSVMKANLRNASKEFALGKNGLATVRGATKSVNSRCGLMIATLGESGTFGVQNRVYRDEAIQGQWVESRITYDVVQPDREAGVFIQNIVE